MKQSADAVQAIKVDANFLWLVLAVDDPEYVLLTIIQDVLICFLCQYIIFQFHLR